ncbi:MAG TPA: glutathione S-transferase family protein [Minicystis sp.]|nr:glutathione S-transferase family protein [Minicystis sp.]
MSIVLYHHPFSRAAATLWMLEEVEAKYEIRHVDIMKGAQKQPDVLALNAMGKLPVLKDGDTVVTENAAIALYLADRYAYGRLCPKVDDPARGTYLRWSLFAPSVIEPGCMAKSSKWEFREGAAGFGNYDAMLNAIDGAIAKGPYVLGDSFSMADVILGGTLRYMTMFKMMESRPSFAAYVERLSGRPALKRAEAQNEAIRDELGLKR